MPKTKDQSNVTNIIGKCLVLVLCIQFTSAPIKACRQFENSFSNLLRLGKISTFHLLFFKKITKETSTIRVRDLKLNHLKGTDTLSGEVALSEWFCFPSEKISTLTGKNSFLLE